MTTKIFYRSNLDVSREYATLTLTVYQSDSPDHDYNKGAVTFAFQANMAEDKSNLDNWYGGRMTIETSRYDDISKLSSFAKRLLDKDKYGMVLGDILGNLESKGTEVTYDARVSCNVPLDEVLSAEYKRYIDKPSYPKYGCLARSEEEAQEELIKIAVEQKDFDHVVSFVQGGKHVYLSNGYHQGAPQTEDIRTRIAKLG